MVRLEVTIPGPSFAFVFMFQFLYGAIGRAGANADIWNYLMFQFLYGAIGSTARSIVTSVTGAFQFLYGAIGSAWKKRPCRLSKSFNSYMVRLEESKLA